MGLFFKKKKAEEQKAEETVVQTESVMEPEIQEEIPQQVKEKRTEPWIVQENGIAFCGDDRETYLEILHDYCEEGKEYRQKLAECLAQEDWTNFAVYVHAVKSTSKTIGSEDFGEEARVLEFAAKEQNTDLIRANWEEFCEHYDEILSEAMDIIGE